MDLKSFHVEDISCTLCENRRGINSTCCCPEDAKDLVLITEEKLRRRIGLEAHQKLCEAHASKLKNGLLFGGSSVCCAPFHVNTARSPGLRSVPHSWKEYFPSPTHSDVRYRPRQRICWDCYAIALEVINAEQLDSSDDESSPGGKSSPSCLGYVSPRRWASNLSLFPTSPHGSQFGSAWSLTQSPFSPKPASLRGIQCHDKDFESVRTLRDSVNAQSATSRTPTMEEERDVVQSPFSPSDVFTTWSLDSNHNVMNRSSDHSDILMESYEEEIPAQAPAGLMSSSVDAANISADPQSILSSTHESRSRNGEGIAADDENVAKLKDGNQSDSKTHKSSQLTIDPSDLLSKSPGSSVDRDATSYEDTADISKMEREKEDATIDKGIVGGIADNNNQFKKIRSPTLNTQITSGDIEVDSSSDKSFGSDWVLVQSTESEGMPCDEASCMCLSNVLIGDLNQNQTIADCKLAHIEPVLVHDEYATENVEHVLPVESCTVDESFRFDPIVAAAPADEHDFDSSSPENMTTESSRVGGPQSDMSNVATVESRVAVHTIIDENEQRSILEDDRVAEHLVIDATETQKIEDVDDHLPDSHTRNTSGIAAHSALKYVTDDSSSGDDDFRLRPIVEEPIDTDAPKVNNSQSYDDVEDIRPLNPSHASDASKQNDLDRNQSFEAINDSHDGRNKNSLREVCANGELPPISYMHERRKVKLDYIQSASPTSSTFDNDVASQRTTLPENQNELTETPRSAAKTYLYKHLHGSKDTANSSASDQECEPAASEGHVPISNPSQRSDSPIEDNDDTKNAESQDAPLLRRRVNDRTHSVDVEPSALNHQRLPLRPSIRSDRVIANRQNGWREKKRKFGVTFALPSTNAETFSIDEGERKKNAPLERALTEIVESQPDSRMSEETGVEDEIPTRPKTLRESRRISNKERLSSLQKRADTTADETNKQDQAEDEDVSAILSEIMANVFTTNALVDWAKSLGEGSLPMIVFAGVSITAALSLSLIAFLALR